MLLAQALHLGDAGRETATRLNLILLGVKPELIFGEGCVRAGGGGRAEVVLVEGDGQRGVGGKDELGITLAPVSL